MTEFNTDYEYSEGLKSLIYPSKKYHMSEALREELNLREIDSKLGMSEDRVMDSIDELAKAIAFYRKYPDLFIDAIKGEKSNFNLFFYQRVFLRAVMRHRYIFATFPRAYSKSFLSMFVLFLRCIFYPGAKLFIVSGTKEQGASIAKEKIEEITDLIPALKNEYDEKKSQFGKDYVKLSFHNGSRLDVVVARNSTRGGRRHGGLIEEVNKIALIHLFRSGSVGLQYCCS